MESGGAGIRNRSNLKTNNANAFNPNINNPFLVTTYAPPSLALYAKNAADNTPWLLKVFNPENTLVAFVQNVKQYVTTFYF
jgi:hypothetical protein